MEKVSLKPGRLKMLCDQKNITLSSLSMDDKTGAALIDKKTIREINKGESVKIQTMVKLCGPLGMSLDGLLETSRSGTDESAPNSSIQGTSVIFDDLNGCDKIPALEADLDQLINQLQISARQRQKILPASLSENQEAKILELEKWLRGADGAPPPSSGMDEDFTSQIREKKLFRQFFSIQNELKQMNLKIMIASYDFWEASDNFYNRHEKNYCSTNIFAIAVVPKSLSVLNFQVYTGEKPPRGGFTGALIDPPHELMSSESPVHVLVNGKYLGVFGGGND